MKQFPQSFI